MPRVPSDLALVTTAYVMSDLSRVCNRELQVYGSCNFWVGHRKKDRWEGA